MHEVVAENSCGVSMPLPQVGVVTRPGVLADLPFIDALQKMHTKAVGWMPTAQLEGHLMKGHVLVAEKVTSDECTVNSKAGAEVEMMSPGHCSLGTGQSAATPLGYCIAIDRYFKREDTGIVYQMNVVPGSQRGLVGATLLKAQFDRSAYGCRLYCCWCAQDLAANRFWEAMGFVPLAFRAGSERNARVHIFWQKRIRPRKLDGTPDDTPWWFPSKTGGGSLREDRIVLPIPPGTHWSDAKPLIYPELPRSAEPALIEASPRPRPRGDSRKKDGKAKQAAVEVAEPVRRNGLCFEIPKPGEKALEVMESLRDSAGSMAEPPKREKVKRVCDPKLVSAARELRDRWLEQVAAQPMLIAPSRERYDVSRSLPAPTPAPGSAPGSAPGNVSGNVPALDSPAPANPTRRLAPGERGGSGELLDAA